MSDLLFPIETWRWLGTPRHYICAYACRFHLATQVGPYLISSVGARYDGDVERPGPMVEIGWGRHYETMVFWAGRPGYQDKRRLCEIEGAGFPVGKNPYMSDAKAEQIHLAMCVKYANKFPHMVRGYRKPRKRALVPAAADMSQAERRQ